jgi:ABC-type branched-subunit amino acid transport system ATPase component
MPKISAKQFKLARPTNLPAFNPQALGTRLLLLDEPFEGLAPALARRLGEILADLKTQRVSVLIAESNERHVADLLACAFRIERGSVTRQN